MATPQSTDGPRARKRDPLLDEAIRLRYPQEGPGPIAADFGRCLSTVSRRAHELKVRCLTQNRRRVETKRLMSTSVDHAYFDKWSPNSAWLVGYTWTDGSVVATRSRHGAGLTYRVQYRCQAADEHLMHDIYRELRCTAKMRRFPYTAVRGKYVGQPQIGFVVNSKQIVERLIEIGVVPNKSNLDPPLPTVPDELFGHFARGVLDGDGSLMRTRGGRGALMVFIGSHQFIRSFRDRVSAMIGVATPTITPGPSSPKLSRIAWYRAADILRLLAWMYPEGDHLMLRRKAETARAILAEGLVGRFGRLHADFPVAGENLTRTP